mmetsp:Transcript_17388/g.16590  ORF Transcript_17388/g.16590 Transcript_17388/m.16590 type:complete len:94 (+) Transcript_17388:1777-2058(+)
MLFNKHKKKFAEVKIQKARGTHLIYKSREAKMDLDIERILVKNFADANEEFRLALYPGSSQQEFQTQSQETMVRVRSRDKFIVVLEAPWQVFD